MVYNKRVKRSGNKIRKIDLEMKNKRNTSIYRTT